MEKKTQRIPDVIITADGGIIAVSPDNQVGVDVHTAFMDIVDRSGQLIRLILDADQCKNVSHAIARTAAIIESREI